jgi:hypothetical protein
MKGRSRLMDLINSFARTSLRGPKSPHIRAVALAEDWVELTLPE